MRRKRIYIGVTSHTDPKGLRHYNDFAELISSGTKKIVIKSGIEDDLEKAGINEVFKNLGSDDHYRKEIL